MTEANSEAFRILGVAAVDFYIPIFSLVFGEAQLAGKAAIILLARPRWDTDGVMPPRQVCLRRLIKLTLPELGRTFGPGTLAAGRLYHGFSANLEKLDWKNLAFCGYCQVFLADYLRDHGLVH